MVQKSQPAAERAQKPARELIERVGNEVRRLGAQNVITSQTVADRFGLHTTDLECLDVLFLRGGEASAGELAQATGLTSGATTTLIDRLEKAGYVKRVADPNDRRRQLVRIQRDAIEPIRATYLPMQAEMFKLWSSFSAQELEVIATFLSRSIELARACVERIRDEAPPAAAKRSRARSRSSES